MTASPTAAEIAAAITAAAGNVTAAAAALGMSRSTLRRRIAETVITTDVEPATQDEAPEAKEDTLLRAAAAGARKLLAGNASGGLIVIAEVSRTDITVTPVVAPVADAAPAGLVASKVMQRMNPAEVALKAPYAVTRTMLANGYADATIAAPDADAAPAPSGLVSPVRLYAILMDRKLAAAGLTEGNVRNWFRKLVMGFPALNVTEDGAVHQAPVDVDGKRVSRPVVDLDAGIAWYAAYLARDAARASARLTPSP